MNLHGEVVGMIAVVNPPISVVVQTSTGYTVDPVTMRQVPTYTTTTASMQVQALNEKELEHLHSLNIEGVLRRIYAFGDIAGVVRAAQKGGDLLTFGGRVWKVVHVFEVWPDWCSVAVAQQVDI